MLEGVMENNKDGIIAMKTAFAKTSCTKAKEETGIDSSHDRLVNLLALKLKMFVSFQRWSVHAMATWSNSGMTKRKTTASPSTTVDAKGMETNSTLSPSVRTGVRREPVQGDPRAPLQLELISATFQ
jgi:hypothetical protein